MNKAAIEAQEQLKREEEDKAVKARLNRLRLMQADPDGRISIDPAMPNPFSELSQALTGLLECFFSAEENNLELTHVSSKTP